MNKTLRFVVATLMLCSGSAFAGVEDNIKIGGFASAAYAVSDSEDAYSERIDEDGSWDETRLALNISAKISNKLSFAGQILMAGRENNFDAHADWAFGRYKFSDTTSVLFGKIKYPSTLFSEFYDVGYLYPWSSTPQELYNLEVGGSGAVYESVKGASLLFTMMPDEIEYVFQPFVGNADMEDGTMKKLVGFMVGANGDNFQVKVGYNKGEFHPGGGHGDGGEEGEEGVFHDFDDETPDKETWNFGASGELGNLVGYVEYARIKYDGFSGLDTDAGYATLGYRINKFLPHITFASFEQDNGREQESVTLGVKYALTDNASLKLDWSVIDTQPPEEDDGEGWHGIEATGLFFDGTDDEVNIVYLTLDVLF